MLRLFKQPGERRSVPVAIAGVATIQALHGVTVAALGLVPSGPALSATAQIFASAVTLHLEGGADGERYLVTVTADDATGQRVEEEIEVAVIDESWAMPDGGAPMLSIAAFVARVGLDEVIRLTDADGTKRIGRELLIAALSDAQAIVEAHVAAVAQLPLATVPRILELAVADLARERLYTGGAPEGVAAAAKTAMRLLERIQSGAMPLALSAGAPAAPAAVIDPITVTGPGARWPDGRIPGFDG